MTSEIKKKNLENAASTTLKYAPPISSMSTVSTYRQQTINIPKYQLPDVDASSLVTNPWYFNAVGNFQNALSNGTQQTIKIDRAVGSGKTTGRVWLRCVLQNTDASNDAQLSPMPFWFQNIQFQNPSGDIIVTDTSLSNYFKLLACTSFEEFYSTSDLVCMNNNYNQGNLLLRSTTKEYMLPLYGNPFSAGEVPTRVIQGDCQCLIQFASTQNSMLNVADPTKIQINSLSLVFEMQNADSSVLDQIDNEYHRFEHSFYYPFPRIMNWTQTFNSSSQYTFQTSGFTGAVCGMVLFLSAGNTGAYNFNFIPIASWQLLDSSNLPISGSNFITPNYNRWGQLPRWAMGTWMQSENINVWNFSTKNSGLIEMLTIGRNNGAFGFSGNESIVVNTPPAGTNEVLTIATGDSTAPTGGNFQFSFTDEWGNYALTSPIAYNATAAAIKAAIEAMPNFQGTVTVNQALTVNGTATITFGGVYANRAIRRNNMVLQPYGNLYNATIGQGLSVTLTTPGVDGMTSGATHYLTAIAYTPALMSISSDKQQSGWGKIRVQTS